MQELSEAHIELLEKHYRRLISRQELSNALANDFSSNEIEKFIADYSLMQDVIVWDAIQQDPDMVSASKYLKRKNGKLYWIIGGLLCAVVTIGIILLNSTDSTDTESIENGESTSINTEMDTQSESNATDVTEIETPATEDFIVIKDTVDGIITTDTILITMQNRPNTTDSVRSDDIIVGDNHTTPDPDTLSDNNGNNNPCTNITITANIEIMEPCEGEDNGSISFTGSGGTAPYLFILDNEETNDELTNISAGFYELISMDKNGCSFEQEIEVEEKYCTTVMEKVYSLSTMNSDYIDLPVTPGTFSVINSGGKIIYRTSTDNPKKWNCVDKYGNFLTTGAYTFIYQSAGEAFKGEINIIR
jgi:hypothetical protein